MLILRRIWDITADAFYAFLADDGWAIASHIALSTLMSLFPFLIVVTALAGFFFGSPQLADEAAKILLEAWPPAVAAPLARDIHGVLTSLSGSVLTFGVVFALYFGGVLRYKPKEPHWPQRDRFILSKGHAAPLLYAVLAEAGYFPVEQLMTLRKLGSPLEGHPNMRKVPGVEASTGSLGQGLSLGVGHAHGPPERLGEDLVAQADREHWYICLHEVDEQALERVDPRVLSLVVGAHPAAEHDDAVSDLVDLRHRAVPQGAGAHQPPVAGEPVAETVDRHVGIELQDGGLDSSRHGEERKQRFSRPCYGSTSRSFPWEWTARYDC